MSHIKKIFINSSQWNKTMSSFDKIAFTDCYMWMALKNLTKNYCLDQTNIDLSGNHEPVADKSLRLFSNEEGPTDRQLCYLVASSTQTIGLSYQPQMFSVISISGNKFFLYFAIPWLSSQVTSVNIKNIREVTFKQHF